MPPSITAGLLGDTPPEPVLLTVAGLPVDGSVSVTVFRETPGEPSGVVHGLDGVIPTQAVLQAPDLTAPMGRPLIYVLSVVPLATGVPVHYSVGPITVTDAGRHVLSSPWSTSTVPVDLVLTADERTEAARVAELTPTGRRAPVRLYDVRAAATGTLAAYTRTAAETAALARLVRSDPVIVSRHPADGCAVPAVEILGLGDVTHARRSVKLGDRVWSIAVGESDDPDPGRPVVLVRQVDAATFYTGRTQAARAADYATQLAVAQASFGVLT